MNKPKVVLEQVQHGYWLVDCESKCGTLGVWPIKRLAARVKREHVCGEPVTVAGKVKAVVQWGPRPGGT